TNIKCDEALSVENFNLYYINFGIDANGNIKAFCSLVGFNSHTGLNNDFEYLLKMKTQGLFNEHLKRGSPSSSSHLDIRDAKRIKEE
uniref:Uncharacterized protein n=1 Tax=Meloidogyne javanica TaxID=6303 RepID=A0A915N9S7_MELJA